MTRQRRANGSATPILNALTEHAVRRIINMLLCSGAHYQTSFSPWFSEA